MRSDPIRIAVVGFGAIAEKHIEVFRHLGAEICAACNRSEEGRAKARDRGGITRTYADPLEMVEREKPAGLLVTVSVTSVAQTARTLIPMGVPILLEKPPGLSLSETEELTALAAEHSTSVMVGLNRRFYSVYHRALEALGGREAVTSVSVEWSEDPVRMRQLGHPEEVIRGLTFANSLHGIDLLTLFGGDGIRGTAWGRDLGGGYYRWQMAFDGESDRGVRLHFSSSWDVPGRWRLVVDACDTRMVSAPLESAVLFRRGKSPEEIPPTEEDQRFKPGFHGQALSFLEVVRGSRVTDWPACSLGKAATAAAIAERLALVCENSAQSRSAVNEDDHQRCY